MKTVFNLHNALKRSQIELTSDIPYSLLCEYLLPYQKGRFLENTTFRIATGKKNYDIIRLFECGQYFFSQKFIDVVSQYMDMSDKCYPIKVEGAEVQYYAIYNLDVYPYLNEKKASFDEEPSFYCGKEIKTSLFSIKKSLYRFVVTEKLMNALIKNKISNIEFEECFLCTKEEYKEWRKNH
ncbi:MAG: hypothetical protein K6D91_06930 [Prevotella sp.]|nr:hypothetical protein [Prevotella sp.]